MVSSRAAGEDTRDGHACVHAHRSAEAAAARCRRQACQRAPAAESAVVSRGAPTRVDGRSGRRAPPGRSTPTHDCYGERSHGDGRPRASVAAGERSDDATGRVGRRRRKSSTQTTTLGASVHARVTDSAVTDLEPRSTGQVESWGAASRAYHHAATSARPSRGAARARSRDVEAGHLHALLEVPGRGS